jgi:acetyl esterase/lipase
MQEERVSLMAQSLQRRAFLQSSAAAAVSMTIPTASQARSAEIRPQTITYKTVGKCQIKADVYAPSRDKGLPVAVWIHGGALIMGDRRGIDRRLLAELHEAGYGVVSIDYRLAPETKLPAILDDLRDALAWASGQGPRTFLARTNRIVVLGGSAGGYLTLVSGYLGSPRPSALVSFWGYGDIAGPWYSRPDHFYRRQPLVSRREARAAVGTEAIAEPPPNNQRSRFYLYCRQNGLWPKEVTGHDPDAEPKVFDRFCPVRNISATYPPTLLIHGTDDTDVPHEQSVLMDRELTRHHVPHEFVSVTGAGHGLRGADRADVARVHDRVMAFLRRLAD